mmetsp:Transcript_28331/g.47016  ORF Transcript_28331/g.47016 Transcript_28331/m.47016 type:complete len:212 (-) Transcript_28331:48-683(-)
MVSPTTAPIEQPIMTPITAPASLSRGTTARDCWAALNLTGRMAKTRSIVLPKITPQVSDTTCPRAAAVIVARPSCTPRVLSIIDPAWIIMKLSMNPNPIMGTAADSKMDCTCCQESFGFVFTLAAGAPFGYAQASVLDPWLLRRLTKCLEAGTWERRSRVKEREKWVDREEVKEPFFAMEEVIARCMLVTPARITLWWFKMLYLVSFVMRN